MSRWLLHLSFVANNCLCGHAFIGLGVEPGILSYLCRHATRPGRCRGRDHSAEHGESQSRSDRDEELDNTKQMAFVTARFGAASQRSMASDMALNELYGLGYDFSDHEREISPRSPRPMYSGVAQTYCSTDNVITTPVMP